MKIEYRFVNGEKASIDVSGDFEKIILELDIIVRIFWYNWNLSITEVFSCLDINFVFEISDFFDLFKSQTLKKWNLFGSFIFL